MAIAHITTPAVTPSNSVTTVEIGPYTLRYGPRPRVGGWFIRDAKSGAYLPLPSFAAVRHYLSELRKKYEPTDPEPTTPAIVTLGECDGFMNAHWNLPKELQRTPATVMVAGKSLCAHCAAERAKSIAAYDRANKPGQTHIYAAAA